MEYITIEVTDAPDVKFEGELIASESSSPNRAMGNSWSGETGRWTVLRLYSTNTGLYVCQRISRTQWDGERDQYEAIACKTTDAVKKFFGHGWIARGIYAEAEIDCAVSPESILMQ